MSVLILVKCNPKSRDKALMFTKFKSNKLISLFLFVALNPRQKYRNDFTALIQK